MKVLITGAAGQVGRSLLRTAPDNVTVETRTREQLDLARPEHIEASLKAANPDVVINTAAYTAVDRAEKEAAQAHSINDVAVQVLAQSCHDLNARLIHISTDYVFNGRSAIAYKPDTPTDPINVYGASKLAGEQHIARTHGLRWSMVRTSWVYAAHGQNFVLTMLRLMRERGEVSVVCDQIGAPTSARNLARFLWSVVASPEAAGAMHYTDSGVASWYDFAVAINEEALACGILRRPAIVKPIVTAEYPTAARRPAMSVLDTKGSVQRLSFAQPHWRVALREVLQEIGSSS